MKLLTKDERSTVYFDKKGKPPTEWDWEHRLWIDRPANQEVCEIGNVYSTNSTYLEITDESQNEIQLTGMRLLICLVAVVLGLAGAMMFGSTPFHVSAEEMGKNGNWFATLFGTTLSLLTAGYFGANGIKVVHGNLFTLKRRPIRLNRKTRRIYAFLTKEPDGLWQVPWTNGSFFCIGRQEKPGFSASYFMYDIRHYTLDADGNVVRGFVLGRLMFTLEQAQQQWEYYRRYMQDGPADLPEPHRFWNPRESFWEGFKICREDKLSSLFSSLFDYVFFPFMLLDATVRWLVLATCSDPVWPAEIEAACKPEPNDPYARPYADDYIGFASGPGGRPSRADLERAWALEPQRRREGALTRSEAEVILKQQKSQAVCNAMIAPTLDSPVKNST